MNEFIKIRKLVLILTSRCYHRCKYCFDRTNYPTANIDYTAQDIINFFDRNIDSFCHDKYPIELFIHGGDLALVPKLDEILAAIESYSKLNFAFHFFFATLEPSFLNKYPLITSPRSNIMISMDGPEHIHNRNRIRKDGKNSFKEIEWTLDFAKNNKNISFGTVLCDNTIADFEEINSFFERHCVRHGYVHDRRHQYWTNESIKKLLEIGKNYQIYGVNPHTSTYESYMSKYIVFADGTIQLFGNEFLHSHKLLPIGHILEDETIENMLIRSGGYPEICFDHCYECNKKCQYYDQFEIPDNPISNQSPGIPNNLLRFSNDEFSFLIPDEKQYSYAIKG